MSRGKKIYFGLFLTTILIVTIMCSSYAFFANREEYHGKLNLVAGTLDYKIESDFLEKGKIEVSRDQELELVVKVTSLNQIDSKYELFYNVSSTLEGVEVGYLKDTKDSSKGMIGANDTKEITVGIKNHSESKVTVTFGVHGGLTKADHDDITKYGIALGEVQLLYKESILNGTEPILADNLIPVTISNDGTVKKADLYSDWYSYEKRSWANAIILKDESKTYQDGEVIPEEEIESYFVWIPKYSYQLWDLGNYTKEETLTDAAQEIHIKFGTSDTTDSTPGECTTPRTAGATGNCKVGDYMTHPAFLAFDTTGFWVGKFETGYEGATTTASAEVNSNDSSKIIIKPNVYSWRGITVGNMFTASYNYKRDLDSHIMKNTEWGSVAYLGHSAYGSNTSVRINNNSVHITGYAALEEPTLGYSTTSIEGNRSESTSPKVDGNYTKNYLNPFSQVASTTGNYSGVYDMSGGAWEYVSGYTTGGNHTSSSGFNPASYDSKYFDIYSSMGENNWDNRILGDATGEMGPFQYLKSPDNGNRPRASWYQDDAIFVIPSIPWFARGGGWYEGILADSFAFARNTGGMFSILSFRIVLAPTNK